MAAPVAYTNACPLGNDACQRNLDAQTLSYIGQRNAAMVLMCQDPALSEALLGSCGITLSLY
jgi:hypothetical protein